MTVHADTEIHDALGFTDGEREMARTLAPALADYLGLSEQLLALAGAMLASNTGWATGASPAARAVALVLVRLLEDLRVCMLATFCGHAPQALTIVAGMLELGHTASFLGADDARAERWLTHAKAMQVYPPLKVGIKATAGVTGVSVHAEAREYGVYRDLSMAKQGNPAALAQMGLDGSAQGLVQASRRALRHALQYAWLGGDRVCIASHRGAGARVACRSNQ